MIRRKVLRSVAFKKEPPLLDAETKDNKICELVYDGRKPSYAAKKEKFGKQCHTLIKKLHDACKELDINVPSDENDTAKMANIFLKLVKENKIDIVRKLLQTNPKLTQFKSDAGDYALHIAVSNRNVDMLAVLIDAGATLSSKNNDKKTFMQMAADLEAWDIVIFIAKQHLTDNKDSANYRYALLEAIKAKRADVVEVLLQANTPTRCRTKNHDGPLHLAVQDGDIAMLTVLIKAGAKLSNANSG